MNFFEKIRGWVKGMFNKKSIEDAYNVKVAITPLMLEKREIYRQLVRGKAKWNDENTPSLHLPIAVSSEVAARVALGLKSEITGSQRADYLNLQYEKIKKKLYTIVFSACNGGEIVLKPYMTENGIDVVISETDCYFPIQYNTRDELIDVIFGAIIKRDKYDYRLFERHVFNEKAKTHEITYRAFKKESNSQETESPGKEIPLSEVAEWAHLQDFTINDIEQPLYVHMRLPSNDVIETPQLQGLPIWSKAIEMFRKADQQEARTDWEFEGGELAIDAPFDWFRKDEQGQNIFPKGKERLFRLHETLNLNETSTAMPYNPEFRIESLSKRMNDILRRIEFDCGLSYGIISDNNVQEKTAEEFRSSKERLITTISTIQTGVLQPVIEHLIKSFDILADLQNIPQGIYDVAFEWNESYAIDRKAEGEERMKWQNMGVLSALENRAWYFDVDVDSEEAKNLPKTIEDEYGGGY